MFEPCLARVPTNEETYGTEDYRAHNGRLTHADNYDAAVNCALGNGKNSFVV
jgi:hypothetical protein